MADKRQLEFFLLRYVPNAVREEFVNIGVVMTEPGPGAGFADVRFTRDWRRAHCIDPDVDVEMLQALERDIRSQLGDVRERGVLLRKLEESFSNLIQLSPTKGCLAEEPRKELDILASLYFGTPTRPARQPASGTRGIRQGMQDAFERAGVWSLLDKDIPVEMYTQPGDSFKIDCGYQVGNVLTLFHAVLLNQRGNEAFRVASRYPKIASRMAQLKKVVPHFTAVVDGHVTVDALIARQSLEEARIRVATLAEMPAIAEQARLDLGA